jgi:hypothetical protein
VARRGLDDEATGVGGTFCFGFDFVEDPISEDPFKTGFGCASSTSSTTMRSSTILS